MPEVPEEYQVTVRRCPLTIKKGPASDPRDVVELDWRGVLDQPNAPVESCSFLLGWDPRLNPPAWVDQSLQYAPAPVWARSEAYIQYLEKKLAGDPEANPL